MGLISGSATFMMIICCVIPLICWFDADAGGNRNYNNTDLKKVMYVCFAMFLVSAAVFWWSAYHVLYPIERGTYETTSDWNRNNQAVVVTKECTTIVFGKDKCYMIKRVTTPYKTVYGKSTTETFGE